MVKTRRTQEERRLETRSKLIDATIAVINDKGYAAMRTTDITRKAGVTWGAAQHLFGSLGDLITEVSLSVSDALVDKLESDIDISLPAEQRLDVIIDRTWQTYSSGSYFAMVEIIRGTQKDPKIRDRLVKAHAHISRKVNRLWLLVFKDLTANDKAAVRRIEEICNLVTLYLSGLAARKIYFSPSTGTRSYIAYIKRIARAELARKNQG